MPFRITSKKLKAAPAKTAKTFMGWEGLVHLFHGQRIYIPAVQMEKDAKPDYLATIDVDPDSPTYGQAKQSIILMPHHRCLG